MNLSTFLFNSNSIMPGLDERGSTAALHEGAAEGRNPQCWIKSPHFLAGTGAGI
jgi:hypothetical protein